ncbi:MAG TPA: Gfo/Idh/MocA family oxidoreductase [Candidatus Sumerlaeota bacterium]|nr:Gfo/Idh/MocA family oxidoreductase [Candidatus Sumerlaeota bacterium]HPK02743.1 Gfo/Idh/MocA family oxidoreductase [Candidatus Sumerlaeota bacterium]
MPAARTLRIGIVGLGHLHPRLYMPHFQALPGVEVTAVAEPDQRLREAFAADFGLRAYASLNDLLKHESLEIAAIFLPHAECAEAAARCAARGIHLMVEKPMASDVKGARRIVQAARKAGVQLTTGYCWRFHPVARRIKSLIAEGAIGRVISAEGRCAAGRVTRYIEGHSDWMLEKARSGGGPIFNLGVHWIDLIRWMLADEVTEATGLNVHVNRRYDIEDQSYAHLRFAGGAVLALDISYTVPDAYPHGRDLYLAIRGTDGVLSWTPGFEGETETLFLCSDAPGFAGAPNQQISFALEPTPGYAGFMGRDYIARFVDAVRGTGEPPVSGEDAVAVLNIVRAIYESDERKQRVKVRN